MCNELIISARGPPRACKTSRFERSLRHGGKHAPHEHRLKSSGAGIDTDGHAHRHRHRHRHRQRITGGNIVLLPCGQRSAGAILHPLLREEVAGRRRDLLVVHSLLPFENEIVVILTNRLQAPTSSDIVSSVCGPCTRHFSVGTVAPHDTWWCSGCAQSTGRSKSTRAPQGTRPA